MKKMIIGLVVGLLIGAASTAAAQSETVQAAFAKFDFVVNGETQQLDADPLVYQGTTYLPVRVVSNMLGYDVTFRADDRQIEMTTAAADEQPQENERSEDGMDTPNLGEWISLRDLVEKYGVSATAEVRIFKDENVILEFDSGVLTEGQVSTFDSSSGIPVKILLQEGRILIFEGDFARIIQ